MQVLRVSQSQPKPDSEVSHNSNRDPMFRRGGLALSPVARERRVRRPAPTAKNVSSSTLVTASSNILVSDTTLYTLVPVT